MRKGGYKKHNSTIIQYMDVQKETQGHIIQKSQWQDVVSEQDQMELQ